MKYVLISLVVIGGLYYLEHRAAQVPQATRPAAATPSAPAMAAPGSRSDGPAPVSEDAEVRLARCHGPLGRHVEYAVVSGYVSDWSLHEMGLTTEQVGDLMAVHRTDVPKYFQACSEGLRQQILTTALRRHTGQDLSVCKWLPGQD
jgi:hypothetical protein